MRWDVGLNGKRIAYFSMPKLESGEVRLAVGDELRLKWVGGGLNGLSSKSGSSWEGDGSVIKVPNSESAIPALAAIMAHGSRCSSRCIGRSGARIEAQ